MRDTNNKSRKNSFFIRKGATQHHAPLGLQNDQDRAIKVSPEEARNEYKEHFFM